MRYCCSSQRIAAAQQPHCRTCTLMSFANCDQSNAAVTAGQMLCSKQTCGDLNSACKDPALSMRNSSTSAYGCMSIEAEQDFSTEKAVARQAAGFTAAGIGTTHTSLVHSISCKACGVHVLFHSCCSINYSFHLNCIR